jgi:hypothetical protein
MGEWRYNSTILDPSARWKLLLNFTLRAFCPQGKSHRWPLGRKLCGAKRRPGQVTCYSENYYFLGAPRVKSKLYIPVQTQRLNGSPTDDHTWHFRSGTLAGCFTSSHTLLYTDKQSNCVMMSFTTVVSVTLYTATRNLCADALLSNDTQELTSMWLDTVL